MFTSTTYTAIKNAKQEYIAARQTLEKVSAMYMRVLCGGTNGEKRTASAAQERATDRLIALTGKLHAACQNDPELIAIVAAEIELEVAA